MKIAYFINQYPKVSHTFIRREIQALESKGINVARFAIRCNEAEIIDENDKEEYVKTRYIVKEPLFRIFITVLHNLIFNPGNFYRTFKLAIRVGKKSERGLLLHLIYFIEACILTKWVQVNSIAHVHAHFGTNSTTVAMLSRQLGGSAFSFTVHGSELEKSEFISLDEKVRHAAFVVAVCSYGRSQLYRSVEYEQWHKIKLIYWRKSALDGFAVCYLFIEYC